MSALLKLFERELANDAGARLAPSTKQESWRYSNLRALDSRSTTLKQRSEKSDPQQSAFALPSLATLDLLRAGSKLSNWSQADRFSNRSAFTELALLGMGHQLRLEHDLHAFNIGGLAQSFANSCLRLEVPTKSKRWLLIEQMPSAEQIAHALFQIELQPGAELNLIHVQNGHGSAQLLQRSEILLHTNARLNYFEFQLGAAWSRHELNIVLDGEGAHASLHQLSLLNARQHADLQLAIHHAKPKASSATRLKAIADGAARAVCGGRIEVAKGADGSDAQLKSQNLLLSDKAEIDTKPELEIYADEVSCSHGATVGQLDERALFYLRSRGIPQAAARELLIYAFATELLSQIGNPTLEAQLTQLIRNKLPNLSVASEAWAP